MVGGMTSACRDSLRQRLEAVVPDRGRVRKLAGPSHARLPGAIVP